MVIQLFVRKSCRGSQKAERWLRERNIPFSRIDIDQRTPALAELQSMANSINASWLGLIDSEGSFWKTGGYAWKVFNAQEELLAHPELLRTPILRIGRKALVGFDEILYQKSLREGTGSNHT